MHPKSTQISVDNQKLGTRKNLPKMQNYLKSTTKNLVFKTPQNGFLVLDLAIKRKKYPKKPLQIRLFLWIFIFGSGQLAHAEIIEKEPKILFKSQVFNTNGFLFLDQEVRTL
jgi:hypothetical protein